MKDLDTKTLFGSIIAVCLLALYVYALSKAICVAWFGADGDVLREGVARTLATVGGLVSALVIAKLAVTRPRENPAPQLFFAAGGAASETQERIQSLADAIAIIYVAVWIGMGFFAFIVGELWFPDKVPALTTFAEAWLGLAVAAGYAYFGLEK